MIKTIHQKDVNRVQSLHVPQMTIKELIEVLQTLPDDACLVGHEQYVLFIQSAGFNIVEQGSIPKQLTIEFDKKSDKKVIKTEVSFNDLLGSI